MPHIKPVSRKPAMGFCTTPPQGPNEAKLCFLLELSTGFFLPVFQAKNPNNNG